MPVQLVDAAGHPPITADYYPLLSITVDFYQLLSVTVVSGNFDRARDSQPIPAAGLPVDFSRHVVKVDFAVNTFRYTQTFSCGSGGYTLHPTPCTLHLNPKL